MTYQDYEKLYQKHGYKFRTEKWALNLGATRSKNSKSDKFDDLGHCLWIDDEGPHLQNFWMTTDPGKHWLLTPMDSKGTIIVVPGQYLNVYGKGLHAGKYECFKQMSPMAYVRDNDRNTDLDFSLYRDPKKKRDNLFWGLNGTNFHRADKSKLALLVGPYSAGCQVVQKIETFDKLIGLRDLSFEHGFKRWDYTLFEE
jgi:hypothetical protein